MSESHNHDHGEHGHEGHDHDHDHHGHDHGEGSSSAMSPEERAMLERRDRAMAHIRQFGDPVLKSATSEVTEFGPDLRQQAERMVALMNDALGVGLAANQVGSLRRLLVYQAYQDEDPVALVNPQIEWLSDETDVITEGCLSMPGIALDVERSLKLRVTAQDLQGEPFEAEVEGIEARIIQHEVDHLDGVLILDRTETEQRRAALRALREGHSYAPPAAEPEDAAKSDEDPIEEL